MAHITRKLARLRGMHRMKLFGVLVLCGSLAAAWGDASKEGLAGRPPLPPIAAIEVIPPALTLEDGRDARRVLVIGRRDKR